MRRNLPIDFMPPTITRPASMAKTPPVHIVGISKTLRKIEAVALA
jgi:hypothetical protein